MATKIDVEAEQMLIEALTAYLSSKGEDVKRDGLIDTPKRFIKQLNENLRGYSEDPKEHAKVFDNDGYSDLILVQDIDFSSQCEHHMVPFIGKVDIGYLPRTKILGLSKFARIIDAYGKRLQVQERFTKQIADTLEQALVPHLLIVRITAQHTCMSTRGVCRPGSYTETVVIRGDIKKFGHYVEHFRHMARGRKI